MNRRVAVCAIVVAASTALGVAPTFAKEGVVARVLTPISRDARPGTKVVVAWTLSFSDGPGKRRPFNAEGVFVRVGGIRSLVDYAGTQRPLGRYRAVIRVPGSGIRSLKFGLMGWNNYAAPVFFSLAGRAFR